MKRGAAAEVDLIKFMTEVRKGANSKKQDAHAKVFAHDLKQQQLAVLQSIDPNGANFEDECRKAKPLADRITDMVATDILASSSKKEMVHVIEFYLKVAHESLKAGDYQSALFLSTAVNGMDISRLGISEDISKEAKMHLAEIRGVIDNNQRFKQFNQFLKTQNGPNIVPITSSIQAQYVGLKEKKTLADTDDVKESLQTGINETKGILRNYVQSAHPEPMQSNLMAKLAAPTLPYDAAYSSGEKDQPEPLSIEGRSRILKKAGANQTINPNTPEAKASTAAVTQYLKTQPASPLPQLPLAAQQPAPLSPPPVAASSSSDKGKEEEKTAGPLLQPIEETAPQARSKYKVGGKVDAKGRKRYEEDGGPNPEASKPQAAASSNDKDKEEEKAQVAEMEPVQPAAADDAKPNNQHDLSFMDVTPKKATTKAAKEVAQELMSIGIEMAAEIPSSDVVNNRWETDGSKIDQAVKYTVGITERVRDSVLLAGSKEEQIKTFRFMLDVMNESLKAGDVNTAMAIYQGLDNTPVNRLKYIAEDKRIAKDFAKAEAFFSPDKNNKNIRDYTNKLAQSGKPVVPSIALFTKDLTFARDGNRTDFKLNEEGEKQLSTIFENFKRSEKANAKSTNKASNNPPVMEQWLNAPRLSEAEADAHSALIKPRGVEVPNFDQVPTRAQVFAAKAAGQQQAPVAQQQAPVAQQQAPVAQQQAPVAQQPVADPTVQAPQMPMASSSSSANSEPEIDYANDPNHKGKKPADDHKNAANPTEKKPIATHAVQAPQPGASSSNSAAISKPQSKAAKKSARPVTPQEMAAYSELKSQASEIRNRIKQNQNYNPSLINYPDERVYGINKERDMERWHRTELNLANSLNETSAKISKMENNNPGLKDAYAAAQAAKQPAAHSVQEDKGKKHAADNASEELKAAKPVKARKIKIPKRVEGKPTGPAPVPPSGSNGPVAQQLANEAPKTPIRKTVRFADEAKSQDTQPPLSNRERLKAMSEKYKASLRAENTQVPHQPSGPSQATAAAGLDPIINDAKQTDAKNKAQNMINSLSKVNAPEVKVSDAGKVEFTVSGNRNSKALQKSLENAGIECQVKKGKGGTTFSFDADKLNALSNQDVDNLVKAARKEFKQLTKELKEKRRAAVVPESAKAEEAKQIAASLKEKAPLPALPVVKVDPPANTTPPPVAASPVDAAAQLANMLNNPMPSNNITAPPLETTAPQPQGFGKPRRRAELGQAAALGNDDVHAVAKPPVVSSFKAAKGFWEAQENNAKTAKEEKGATADAGRKPIKPT